MNKIASSTLIDFINILNNIHHGKQTAHIPFAGLGKHASDILTIEDVISGEKPLTSLNSKQIALFKAITSYYRSKHNSMEGFKEAFKHLKLSTLNSYFTPEEIAKAITEPLKEYMPERPNILEPSAGSGVFIEPLQKSFVKPNITAIEKDFFTAEILQHNYPKITTLNQGYETANYNDTYHLAISNIPFGDLSILDLSRLKDEYLFKNRIHNYFFLKAIDDIKIGGLIAFITTSSFSDSVKSGDLRSELMKKSNLISHVRLPNTIFSSSGTKVCSDIIILQKVAQKDLKNNSYNKAFVTVQKHFQNNNYYSLNSLLAENPQNIIGNLDTHIFNQRESLTVISDQSIQDIASTIKTKISLDLKARAYKHNFSQEHKVVQKDNIITQTVQTVVQEKVKEIKATDTMKEGELYIKNQQVMIHYQFNEPVKYKVDSVDRVAQLINIKKLYQRFQESNDEKIQNQLNEAYDIFTFQYGYLLDQYNRQVLQDDPTMLHLQNLENIQNGHFLKSNVFTTKPAVQTIKTPTTPKVKGTNKTIQTPTLNKQESPKDLLVANTISDAIIVSLNHYNNINIDFIAELLDRPKDEIIKQALEQQLLFIEPLITDFSYTGQNHLVDKSTFESGYIEDKIELYKKNKITGLYENYLTSTIVNNSIEVLYARIPYKLDINDIDPDLGEPWIPIEYASRFATDFFECEVNITERPNNLYAINIPFSHKIHSEYTVHRDRGSVRASDILSYAITDSIPEFKQKITQGEQQITVIDRKTIDAVTIRVEAIQEGWKIWLKKQTDIINVLEERYHQLNNAFVKKEINGSYLTLPELTRFTPHQHQLDAAALVLHNQGGILDHQVGYGKTLTMGIIVKKLVQTGISKKNLLLAMKPNINQVHKEISSCFPSLLTRVVTTTDLNKKNIDATIKDIHLTPYNLVLMEHDHIKKLPMDLEAQKDILEEQLNHIKANLEADKEEDWNNRLSGKDRKTLLKEQEKTEHELAKITFSLQQKAYQGDIDFKDLGFTHILIDESHIFKNLKFKTRHTRVAGLGSGAQPKTGDKPTRNDKMINLIRSVQRTNKGDKGVTFSSATPISNSLSELYTIFNYLRPSKMQQMNMSSFDQWARQFARKTHAYEQTAAGEIKSKERFRYFVKVPELAKLYNDIAHVADNRTFKLDVPELDINFVQLEAYPELKEYQNDLLEFIKTRDPLYLRNNKSYDDRQLNAMGLLVTAAGKNASIDLRLINKDLFEFEKESKLNVMVEKVHEIYQDSHEHQGTQFIMCDIGVPNAEKKATGQFIAYDEIKSLLIEKGIPSNEIAFIHDDNNNKKKKEIILNKFDKGDIRILLGSTSKLGTGVNAQKKAVAIHHLDIPWRPSDFDQRNGRAARQGNILAKTHYNNKVKTFIYGVKGSTDGYVYNTLAIKAGFINQLKHATISMRKIDEGAIDSDGNLSFDDYTAITANETVFIEKVKIEKELAALNQKQYAFVKRFTESKFSINYLTDDIQKAEKTLTKLEADYNIYSSITFSEDEKTFSPPMQIEMQGNQLEINNFKNLGKAIEQQLMKAIQTGNTKDPICTHPNGFELRLTKMELDKPLSQKNHKLLVKTTNGISYSYGSSTVVLDHQKTGEYFKNALSKTLKLPQSYKEKIKDYKERLTSHQNILNQSSPYAKDIEKLKKELTKKELEIESHNEKIKEEENNKKVKENQENNQNIKPIGKSPQIY